MDLGPLAAPGRRRPLAAFAAVLGCSMASLGIEPDTRRPVFPLLGSDLAVSMAAAVTLPWQRLPRPDGVLEQVDVS